MCFNFPVCILSDSGQRNYPINLKFGTDVYVLCEICCTVFGVHCPNNENKGIIKSVSMHYVQWRVLKSILAWLLCIKFNEIFRK